jgi:hypothetical protein
MERVHAVSTEIAGVEIKDLHGLLAKLALVNKLLLEWCDGSASAGLLECPCE